MPSSSHLIIVPSILTSLNSSGSGMKNFANDAKMFRNCGLFKVSCRIGCLNRKTLGASMGLEFRNTVAWRGFLKMQ
jgi:hypothetical protein